MHRLWANYGTLGSYPGPINSAEFPMPSQTVGAVTRNSFIVFLNGSNTRSTRGRTTNEESLRGRFQIGGNQVPVKTGFAPPRE